MEKNLRQKLIAFSLSLTMLLPTSGCNREYSAKNRESGNFSYSDTNAETKDSDLEEEKYEDNVSEQISQEQKQQELSFLKNFFQDFHAIYNYEIPISQEIIDTIVNYEQIKVNCDYTFDGDYDKLIKQIKENSQKLAKEYPQFDYLFLEENLGISPDNFVTTSELAISNCNGKIYNALMEIALEYTLAIYQKLATNNINEDIHQMQSLAILAGNPDLLLNNNTKNIITIKNEEDTITLGIYDADNNIMIINIDQIIYNKDELYYNFSNQLISLIDTFIHEFNHLREHTCSCRYNKGDIPTSWFYNEPYVSSFDEASAESEIYNLKKLPQNSNYTNNINFTYIDLREGESLLFLLGLSNNIEDYYNANFDTDLTKLFTFLEATNPDDIERIMRIIYLIDSINGRNSFVWEYLGYDINTSLTVGDLKYTVGFSYKIDLMALTLRNLINYTEENPDFSWEENLALYNIIRNIITNQAYRLKLKDENLNKDIDNTTPDDYITIYDADFQRDILLLNENYLRYVAIKYGKTYQEVKEYCDSATNSIILLDINSLYYFNDSKSISNFKEIEDLTKRFPILKNILFTNLIDSQSFKNLENYVNPDTEKKLTLEK